MSGTVFPVDWTFTTNSQNYSVTGGEVGFRGGGIYNQGGANSISNDIIGFDILVTGGALVLGGSSVIFSSASVAASSSLTTTGNLLFYYGLTNDGTVNANGGAFNRAIFNNTGATFNVGGSVVGRGTFANASGATLAIRSGGSFTMTTPFSNAGIVTVASGGTLTATAGGINNAATGKITVAAGGTLRDDLNNAGIAINNGAYFATVASNTGTITNNASWTGNVTNTGGTVTNASGATWAGSVNNVSGTFNNGGVISGSVTVMSGAFTGTGSVGSAAFNGSTNFVAGNGIAGSTPTVTGNLVFSSGAAYVVAVDPAMSSRINVGGTATLGGASVMANYANGSYVQKQYTILTAGSVNGTFGSLVNSNLPPNFTSVLSQDANNVYLNLMLDFAAPNFGSGLNQNQQAVASTLVDYFNRTGGIPTAFGALKSTGLMQASGESSVGSQQTTFLSLIHI